MIDGLAPSLLDRAIAEGKAPLLAKLRELDGGTTGCSVFPSLTPVCLSAIAMGTGPSATNIPHMQWFHRGEGRFVEYGSSFAATLVTGTRQAVDDSMVNLNQLHLSRTRKTLFEAIEDAGLTAACINFYVWRGRVRHTFKHRWLERLARRTGFFDATYGPTQLFFGDLFESERTGATRNLGVTGKNDDHAGGVAQWLVARDAFDFLLFYLPETDMAAHRSGPDGAVEAVAHADENIARMVEAAGGLERFLERYAVILTADHSQSAIEHADDIRAAFADLSPFVAETKTPLAGCRVAVAASNRAAMIYRFDASLVLDELASRLAERPSVDLIAWRDGDEIVFRRGDTRERLADAATISDLLDERDYPQGIARLRSILSCINSGDLVVSATPGYEFADAGGQSHLGGGSHGSLHACDSIVPLGSIGLDPSPSLRSITDIAPAILTHFGVALEAASA